MDIITIYEEAFHYSTLSHRVKDSEQYLGAYLKKTQAQIYFTQCQMHIYLHTALNGSILYVYVFSRTKAVVQ